MQLSTVTHHAAATALVGASVYLFAVVLSDRNPCVQQPSSCVEARLAAQAGGVQGEQGILGTMLASAIGSGLAGSSGHTTLDLLMGPWIPVGRPTDGGSIDRCRSADQADEDFAASAVERWQLSGERTAPLFWNAPLWITEFRWLEGLDRPGRLSFVVCSGNGDVSADLHPTVVRELVATREDGPVGDDAEAADGDDAEAAVGDDAEAADGDDAEAADGDDAEAADGDDAKLRR